MLGENDNEQVWYGKKERKNIFLTQALNVLYKENWTVMANMEMIKFQGEMVAALQVAFLVD